MHPKFAFNDVHRSHSITPLERTLSRRKLKIMDMFGISNRLAFLFAGFAGVGKCLYGDLGTIFVILVLVEQGSLDHWLFRQLC